MWCKQWLLPVGADSTEELQMWRSDSGTLALCDPEKLSRNRHFCLIDVLSGSCEFETVKSSLVTD